MGMAVSMIRPKVEAVQRLIPTQSNALLLEGEARPEG